MNPTPPWTLALVAALVIAGAGCKDVELPDPPVVELPDPPVSLPTLPTKDGLGELIQVAGSRLSIDPTKRDPITAVGRCADLVTGCYEQGAGDLDGCVGAARACQTSEPWKEPKDCCPAACQQQFTAARGAGEASLEAFERVFFLEPGCFPGVTALLEGEP